MTAPGRVRVREELAQGLVDRFGSLQGCEVCGVGHVGEAYALGRLGRDPVGQPADVRDVVHAGADQHGYGQFVEAVDRRRVEFADLDGAERQFGGERPLVHLLGEADQLRVDVLGAAARAHHPEPHLTGGRGGEVLRVHVADQVLPELFGLLGPLVAGDGGAEERERRDPIGVGQRGVHRHLAAERAADQGRPGHSQRVEEARHVVVVGERRRRQLGLAVAAQVQGEHPVSGGERVDLPPPHPPVGDAGVQQHHGGAGAEVVVRQHGAVHFDLGHRRTVRTGRPGTQGCE